MAKVTLESLQKVIQEGAFELMRVDGAIRQEMQTFTNAALTNSDDAMEECRHKLHALIDLQLDTIAGQQTALRLIMSGGV